jgi:hypothetical protein
LIDYAITGRPILNVKPTDPNKEQLLKFLGAEYNSALKIENIERYKISNVSKSFLDKL